MASFTSHTTATAATPSGSKSQSGAKAKINSEATSQQSHRVQFDIDGKSYIVDVSGITMDNKKRPQVVLFPVLSE